MVESVIGAEIVDFGVENVFGLAALFDFETVESGGVNDANNTITAVEDGKMLVT